MIKIENTFSKYHFLNFFYRGGSLFANYLIVPISLKYLNKENYGIWLTISSLFLWFLQFDLGLGNGLRNKLTEAKVNERKDLMQIYVSTAYYSLGLFSILIFLIFLTWNYYINWADFFNLHHSYARRLEILMPLVFVFFCFQLVAKLISNIYTADLNHSFQNKLNFYIQLITLSLIWVFTFFKVKSLESYSLLNAMIPFIVTLITSVYSFKGIYFKIRPIFSRVQLRYLKDIFILGLKFFIIQVSGVIIFSTDSFVINNKIGSSFVVDYSVVYKYYSIPFLLMNIFISPYWSSFSMAYTKNESLWIKNNLSNLNKIGYKLILASFILIIIEPYVLRIWIGDNFRHSLMFSTLMCIYFSLSIFYTPYTIFINGTGKIKLQMYSVLFTAILNVPLMIYFSATLKMGLNGIIFANILSLLPHSILCPIQCNKIIEKRAYNIWNQ